jgi:hypothetical protein
VVLVAIVMVVVSSSGHIEASTKMVPVPVSLTDPNSDAADSDIGAFRDDHWFVADVQRTGKCRHRQNRNKKKSKHSSLQTFSWMRRSPSRCSAECALGIPVVCIELTSSVLEMVLERTWFRGALIRTGSALAARSKAAYAFNDVSNRGFSCAHSVCRSGGMTLILICGRSGRMTFNNQMSGYDGHRTIRDLEQCIDEVVTLHPTNK